MIIYYEVCEAQAIDGEPIMVEVAAVGVTDNTQRDVILADLKALYGIEADYKVHYCGHDEKTRCSWAAL